MFKPVNPKQSLPEMEHEILDFWEKNKIFEQSVTQRQNKPKYVFFDGPPFANGLPHYGHILANALKDAVTRYFTMRGYYVPRVNGWDCHGLPVEYEVEKELKLSGRKDIEKMGIAKFNAACRKSVFKYTEEWEKLLKRIARWVDFENSYATLDNEYIESIWWVFKQIWQKDMMYEGFKSMHICPRCETPLSNFEVSLGYKEVTDPSVIIKFKITTGPLKDAYILAWTTTPWTLPGNVLLAVGPQVRYAKVRHKNNIYILAKECVERIFNNEAHRADARGASCERTARARSEANPPRQMSRASSINKEKYEIIGELEAFELERTRYEPLFPFFKHHENAFRVVKADFVSITEGTGVVHIAPGFGDDDMTLGQMESVEPIIHVGMDGVFTPEVTPWAGKFAKGQDLNIKDYLEKEGKLFHFENYRHSYPHCWRCDTPLLNYATRSWFIKVTEIKDKLIKNNKRIHWQPSHIQTGRFGKWLEGARDWAISRNRFWGCPIPIWKCGCGYTRCIESIRELRTNSLNGNQYLFVRHGEAEHNLQKIDNSDPKHVFHLTTKGKKQAEKLAKQLQKYTIDNVFASPFARTKETAEIINRIAFNDSKEIIFDQHLIEHQLGHFDGMHEKTYTKQFKTIEERYAKKLPQTESFEEVEKRTADFINYLDRKYEGKTILIVTHGDVVRAARRYLENLTIQAMFDYVPKLGSVIELMSGKLPMRENALDLHKPYIDEIKLKCTKCGGAMERLPEVLDCWFESGAMPYAQLHYPFENKKEFEDNFPAHFIAEGLDQTRGWFYTLHVLATTLFNTPAFQNVIVNGILLAADGEKLSKRKKNYPDPYKLFETHGVDSTRFFLYSSTAPLAEDVRFSEKHIEDILKKFTLTLWNTYSFFVTYAAIDQWKPTGDELKTIPKNKLDQWMLSELHMLINEVTMYMDDYNLTKATRPMMDFVDNLSNWYIRRSRRRFWKSANDTDKEEAYKTLYTVLITFSKLIAPFVPFVSEAIYKNLTGAVSVHLQDWPIFERRFIKQQLNEEIRLVRKIVALGHAVRAKKNIKVRQPLNTVHIALPSHINREVIEEYNSVILEELNVKTLKVVTEAGELAKTVFIPDARKLGPRLGSAIQDIIKRAKAGDFKILKNNMIQIGDLKFSPDEGTLGFAGRQSGFDVESDGGIVVALDTKITAELQDEGYAREVIRQLQEMRKSAGYDVADRIYICVKTGDKELNNAITKHADFIREETLALELQGHGDFEWDQEQTIDLNGKQITIAVRASPAKRGEP